MIVIGALYLIVALACFLCMRGDRDNTLYLDLATSFLWPLVLIHAANDLWSNQ